MEKKSNKRKSLSLKNTQIDDGERAEYGKKILATLSQQLIIQYVQSFEPFPKSS